MARPRIFVSSTYYDLKHIRASMEIFIESLGYDAVLSEKGDIAYTPDTPLDESCYREAQNSDIYVLIIGGRYGSEVSETRSEVTKNFFDRYESITKQEYKSAVEKDIPIYVLIEKPVYSEYQTFRKNRSNEGVNYAHVDSVNIFHFIEEILAQPRNNPVHTFDRHSEVEEWLREQWAGLFRELIQRLSSQQQLTSLSAQVSGLEEINKTLKRYLEALLVSEAPSKSKELINREEKRLEEASRVELLRKNPLVRFLNRSLDIDINLIAKSIEESSTFSDFLERVAAVLDEGKKGRVLRFLNSEHVLGDFNNARRSLGLSDLESSSEAISENNISQRETAEAPKKTSTKKKATTSKKSATTKVSKRKKAR